MASAVGSIFTTMKHRAKRNAMKDVKGLLAYDTRYGSTAESAYWIKALIGYDQYLEVTGLRQIITLDGAVVLIKQWAREAGLELTEHQKTYYNVHFQARKQDDKKGLTIHIVPATFPEDPGNVHIAFRCNGKAAIRTSAEENIARAEALLWADGRKVD